MDNRSPAAWTEVGQDAELLKQAKRGDLAALLQLFSTHRMPLWRACLVLTRDQGEAERLFQMTLAHATRQLPSAPSSQPALPWLVGLARELHGMRSGSTAHEAAGPSERRPNGKPWESSARNALDVNLEQRALHGFSLLHADDQWLLALRVFEGLSHADIARVTGHPVSVVAERLALARDYLDQVCAAEDRAA